MIYILPAKPPYPSGWQVKIVSLLASLFLACDGIASTTVDASLVDFSSIREVLSNDLLEAHITKTAQGGGIGKKEITPASTLRFDYPVEKDFWSFASEFWLVKNVALLRWNFEKPDYGLEQAFTNFLTEVGYVGKKFKILLLEGRNVFHMALPSDPGEVILLLSVPFIQELDLSKLEINILLFENFYRHELGQMKKKLTTPELEKLMGSNLKDLPFHLGPGQELWAKLQSEYDKIIFSNGFSFQEQFDVTTQVGKILGNKTNHFDRYLGLLKKIENLTKGNPSYLGYNKIYPSPEMQLKWLLPSPKVL